jgi:hypothetical protein
VDAEVGRLSGLNAISRLFSWTEGTFEVHWKSIRRPDGIGLATPELVLEGMKRVDQRNRLAGGLPDMNGVFEVNYRVLAERLSDIPDEVNAVLRLFDGSRTLAHVVEDCQLPDAEAMAIAIRLRDEGIIHNVSRRDGDRAPPLAVPPGRPNAPPVEEDVTVVRRITSLGLGSGPVQQAFTATVGDRAAPSAETVVMRSPFDDVDGIVSPANHAKTDPGLGNALDRLDLDLPSHPPEGPSNDPEPAPIDGAAAPRDAEDTAPYDPSGPNEPAPQSEGLEMDVSSLQTQRGLGPFPDLLSTLGEAGALSVSEAQPEIPPATDSDAAPAIDDGAAPAASPEGVSDAGAQLEGRPSMERMEAPSLAGAESRPREGAPEPDEGARLDAVAEKPNAEEDLDDLEVPGRKRGARVFAVLAVAAVVGAFAIYKLRGGRGAVVTQSPPVERAAGPAAPAAPGPPPPEQGPPAPVAVAAPPAAEKTAPASAPAAENSGEAAATASQRPAVRADDSAATAGAEKAAAAEARGSGEKTVAARAEPAAAEPRHGGAAPEKPAAAAVNAGSPGIPAASSTPPLDFPHQLATCRTQFLRSRYRDAAASCAAALEANPSSADALTMMAHVELNRGRLGRANELAQKAIAIDPNQADAYVIIGGVHQDSGRNAEAKVAYRRYLQLAPHGRYADELRSIVGSL